MAKGQKGGEKTLFRRPERRLNPQTQSRFPKKREKYVLLAASKRLQTTRLRQRYDAGKFACRVSGSAVLVNTLRRRNRFSAAELISPYRQVAQKV